MAFAARMSSLTEQLSKRLVEGGNIERRDLSSQLLNLSKFIDHTVASNQKPNYPQGIYKCFKQLTCFRADEMLRPSVMVLMLSIKSACLAGWFSNSEVEELLQSFTFLIEHFHLNGECVKPPSILDGRMSNEISDAESFSAMICRRYFPRLVVMSVLVALTAKPGYDSLGIDFQVSSQLAMYTKLRLFVCQKDDFGTSACLITPPLLSFLVNGKGVDKRIYVPPTPEPGPQMPSDITAMLRIGCNFLQIVGENTANYFVAVGVMGSVVWSSSSARLEDYVSPSPAAETDDEVIVGRSRISLRCPISLKRILTPVKGVSCRHHQAFDYDSYIEINDRRPSWRCPCCNAYVNCSELRLDRRMEQILKEVDQNLFDVMINHDCSWTLDEPADETDIARAQSEGQTLGDDLAEKLGESVIILSDNEEDDQEVGGILVSPRDAYVAQVSTCSTSSVPPVEVDRKPDIRTILVDEAGGSAPSHIPTFVSSIESPVLNAIYSPISETLQRRPGAAGSVRSVQATQGGYMSTMQSTVRSPASGVPPSGLWGGTTERQFQAHTQAQAPGSGVPPTGLWNGAMERQFQAQAAQAQAQAQAQASGVPSTGVWGGTMERQFQLQAQTQVGRTIAVQALPAQHLNPSDRGRVTLTGQVNPLPTLPPLQVPSAGQTPSRLPAHEVQALHNQQTHQQQLQNAETLDRLMIQELRQLQQQQQLQQRQQQLQQQVYNQSAAVRVHPNLDGNQRNQRHGQQHIQQHRRDARAHQFSVGSSHQAGQGQLGLNQLGQQIQHPINSALQNSLQVQDYYHRHRLSQQLAQAVLTTTSPRISPVAISGNFSGHGVPTGGSHRDFLSHSIYPGRTNIVSNVTVASTTNGFPGVDGLVAPSQLSTRRPAAGAPRMRGAIGGGSSVVMSRRPMSLSGMTQPGQANSGAWTSPHSINAVPQTRPHNTGHGTTHWGGRAPITATMNSEMFAASEPASTTTILDDISWPSTLLENTQMDSLGHIDPGSWIDDSFNPMSPPPQ